MIEVFRAGKGSKASFIPIAWKNLGVRMTLSYRSLLLPLVLLVAISLSVALFTPTIQRVHAAPSLTIQPVSQPLATPGSAVVFHVTVQGMPANFAGWDLYVIADNTVLTPTAITLCNNITCNTPYSDSGGTNFMPSGTDAQCINNVNSGAFNNCGGFDGPGVAHDTFASSGSTLGGLLLFDVTFNAVAGPGATVGFPESVTSSTSQNQFFDTSGIGIFGVSETGGTYGTVGVPFDYSLSNNGPVSVTQGSSGTVTVTATLTGGTAQPVTLSCSGLPSGITCGSFTVNPVTPTTAGATSVLTINVASSVAVGPHSFVVTGSPVGATASGATTTVSVTVTAVPFDYSLSNDGPVSITQGSSGTVTITATLLAGSAEPVTLSCATPLPAGVSCSFATNPVTPTGSSLLTISTSALTPTGAFTLTVNGSPLGASTASTTVSVTVTPAPDFTIAASPTSVSATVGVPATSTITISPLNGFTGDVALVSDNAACTVTPTTVTGGSGNSVLSCTFGAAGTVTVTVTATSASLSHSTTVTYTVTSLPDFAISANPTAVTVTVGSAGTSTITISPLNGFAGDVALASDNAACTLNPAAVTGGSGTSTLSCTFTAAGSVTLTVTGTSGSLSHSATVDFTITALPDFTISASPTAVTASVGSPGTSTITIDPLNGFASDVGLTADNVACTLTPTTVTGGSGTSILSCTFSSAGSVAVTVTGTSGSLSHSATVDFTVTAAADFSIAASPTSVSATVGVPATSTITISPLNGFAGDVALVSDNGECSLSPSTVTGGSGTSTLSCTFTSAGSVTVTVTGTSGSLSHIATVDFTVGGAPDFTITASPTAVTVAVNSPGTSTITISPLNGFTGDVALVSDNSACTLSLATVTGGSGTSSLSCTFTAEGSVTVTVTGTSGSLSHSATVDYTVTVVPPPFDYSLTNNGPISITAGSSGTVTISATLIAGTAQPVALSCLTPLPSGVTCTSFSPSTVTPTDYHSRFWYDSW